MPKQEMTYEDLHRDLRGCVVMYKNRPVYVTGIGHDCSVSFLNLKDQRMDEAPFTLADFTKPIGRVGFVNVLNSIVYVSRIPVRRYALGLKTENLKFKTVAGVDYPNGSGDTKYRVQTLAIPELADAIMDRYPSFKDAVEQVRKFKGACAFDKQFAVTSRGYVIYKGDMVGTVALDAKTTEEIQWNGDKQYLKLLLDGNYEKTVRDFRPTSR